MAGTLTISTLSDGTNSTSATNCIQGSAKAWVNFDGQTTATIRASYNVSSVTYNSSGDYTVNFTSAFADANYAPVGIAQRDSANICVVCIFGSGTYNSLTTTTARFFTKDNANNTVAALTVGLAFFR
jgi:hypothetical protein